MKQAVLRYKIIRIRSKISFLAFKNNKTIQELILENIHNSFANAEKNGLIYKNPAFNYDSLNKDKETVETFCDPWF